MAYWEIMDSALKEKPISKRQHAFRVGMSTESAISQTLNYIEKGFHKGKISLGVFIDISSAFDKLDPKAAIIAMEKKGVDKDIISWYNSYLCNRLASIEIKGKSTNRQIKIGCPQGGILSVLLWLIAFDELLNSFGLNDLVEIVGYADDACLLINGDNLKEMYGTMNRALNKAQTWAINLRRTICPKKTTAMILTNKNKYNKPLEL